MHLNCCGTPSIFDPGLYRGTRVGWERNNNRDTGKAFEVPANQGLAHSQGLMLKIMGFRHELNKEKANKHAKLDREKPTGP